MASRKPQPKLVSHHEHHAPHPTVSARWLLTALAIVIPAAASCAWAVLCLLFWQGSWQLLYHPASSVNRTPAAASLAFDPIGFDPTDTGAPQLQGWWIASPSARFTVLYLHGAIGNLSDTIDDLTQLHAAGVNVFAFDYRGYGQSVFAHPGEARWRQDAESALNYLTATRHIDAHLIVLDGTALGANLALEVAAAHPELAGVVLDAPLDNAAGAILNDPRAHLVPARLLVSDRYDMAEAAAAIRIPSLWLVSARTSAHDESSEGAQAFQKITSKKMRVWIVSDQDAKNEETNALTRWLDDLNR
jgi:pimeloyl-ACP methyl ester carboxylesterase